MIYLEGFSLWATPCDAVCILVNGSMVNGKIELGTDSATEATLLYNDLPSKIAKHFNEFGYTPCFIQEDEHSIIALPKRTALDIQDDLDLLEKSILLMKRNIYSCIGKEDFVVLIPKCMLYMRIFEKNLDDRFICV